jgi:hypothetical protein
MITGYSALLDGIGLGGIDIAYILIGMLVMILVLLILIIVQMVQASKLKKRLNRFLMGNDGMSMEQDIISLIEDNKFLKIDADKNKKEMRELRRKFEHSYQKMGLVKYDAFQQMGGQLSFSLCLLDNNNNGFIINSVHSAEGCYSYTKEIKAGESSLLLGEEEKEALEIAMSQK